ncbi:MAG: DNA polymerase III subunit delta [bacterium]
MISPKQLATETASGKFAPTYFFFGTEDYRITEAIRFVARQFLSEEHLKSNLCRLDGRKTPAADVINELSALSLLAERRVIAVSNFQSYGPKDYKAILALSAQADQSRVVILSSPASALAKGRKAFVDRAVFKAVSKAAQTVEFNRQTPADIRPLVVSKLQGVGLQIETEALNLLVSMIAGNRGGFENEVAKLINYQTPDRPITTADIRRLCSGYELFSVFDLADSIIGGDKTKVMALVDGLLADGNGPIALGVLLQQHFTCLYLVKGGQSPLRGREWLAGRFRQQAAGFTQARLERVIESIAKTDASFRGGNLKPEAALQLLILDLMS